MEIVISLISSDAAELRALATFEELPLPDVVVSAVRARIVAARERAAVLDRNHSGVTSVTAVTDGGVSA